MVVGVGIDLQEVQRLERMVRRRPELLIQVFSPDELELCRSCPLPLAQFAAAFALKEAMFKALGQGWLESGLFWTDIELLSPLTAPRPQIRLSGPVGARRDALGGAREITSFSYCGTYVVAQVIIVSSEDCHE